MKVQGVDSFGMPMRQEVKVKALPEKTAAAISEVKGSPDQPEKRQESVIDRHKLEEAVDKTNKIMETYTTELRFSIHEASGELMVKVINTKDNTVIREIPPERILDFIAHVKKMLGIIVDKLI